VAAFAKFYGQLGDFSDAISSYEHALSDEQSTAPLKIVQQMANLMERHARTMDPTASADLIAKDIDTLEKLSALVDTAEQASLLGAFYKRQGEAAAPGSDPR